MAITNKVVSRVVGGITGKGSKNVNPVYKNTSHARAVENKARKEFGMSEGITTGKLKAVKKASPEKMGRTIGSAYINQKGQIAEYMSDKRIKGPARKIKDNAQRAELEAKGYSKRASILKYPSKKLLGNPDKPTTPKVPVKRSK